MLLLLPLFFYFENSHYINITLVSKAKTKNKINYPKLHTYFAQVPKWLRSSNKKPTNMKILRWLLYLLISLFLIGIIWFFFFAGQQIDQQKNRCFLKKLPKISEKAKKLHLELVIADWHADNLLWDRNPLKRLNYGHIDIPRLIEGNVTLQVFDAVIKTPRGQNYKATEAKSDNITLLTMANRWPIRTWNSLCERAVYQSEKLHKAAEQSNGSLQIIRTKKDLQNLLATRKTKSKTVGGLLSIEGLHALEGNLENVRPFV